MGIWKDTTVDKPLIDDNEINNMNSIKEEDQFSEESGSERNSLTDSSPAKSQASYDIPEKLTIKTADPVLSVKLSARVNCASPHDSSGPSLSMRESMELEDEKQSGKDEEDLRKLTVKHTNILSQAVNIPPPLSETLKVRTPSGSAQASPMNALRIEQDSIPRTPRVEEMKKEQTQKAIRRESWPNSVWCLTVELHTVYNIAHAAAGVKPYYPPPKKIDTRRYIKLDDSLDFEDCILYNILN